jgi:acetyl-CoA carboxylase biotin carboxylase subunit
MSTSRDFDHSSVRPFRKVLVANRGEIAVRIVRGLRDHGIVAAGVYSDADRDSLAVRLADEAYRIGPAPSAESYLRADAIADLAAEIGADAVHPGYGFLSENGAFAETCAARGIAFIGPPPSAIAAMGSKIESRRLMIRSGVPVVPGGHDPVADEAAAAAEAVRIGFPVMIKASAGGGGKGMRRVDSPEDLASAFRAARSEALASFGDGAVYVERYVVEPRHVEIQILGDQHGRVVSLGERECSLQRRHQKVLEEAPSPVVDPALRKKMGQAAVQAAEAVGYTNAGTVEFLLDKHGEFFFLEMNTRLQVEHPVTEMVTGIDLVSAQLRIAMGEPLARILPPDWNDGSAEPRGHAIEVRLYAEDPFRGFAPSPGRIVALRLPDGPGVRCDCGTFEGGEVTIHYDPMIAKLIAWGADRGQAIRRLERALAELRVEGIQTSAPLFRQILADDDFRRGELDIGMLERKLGDGSWGRPAEAPSADLPLVAAIIAHAEKQTRTTSVSAATADQGPRAAWRQAARRESVVGGSA